MTEFERPAAQRELVHAPPSSSEGGPVGEPRQTPEEQNAAFRAQVATLTDRQLLQQTADDLLMRMRTIENQLASRRAQMEEARKAGEDLSPDYFDWRRRAVASKNLYTAQYRIIRERIKALNVAATRREILDAAGLPTLREGDLLLRHAYQLLVDLARSARVRYQPREQALLDAVREYIHDPDRESG